MIFFSKRLIPLLALLFAGILVLLSFNPGGAKPVEKAAQPPYQSKHGTGQAPRDVPVEPVLLPESIPFPELNAHAYLVRLLNNEEALAKRREFKKLPQASLIKLLTATAAQEIIPQTLWITFSAEAQRVEEKKSRVNAGESLLRDDVMRLALIESANDAAYMLAQTAADLIKNEGNPPDFMEVINAKAKEIGMENSRFANPMGLDPEPYEPQYSTAEDLSRLAEYIWINHPRIWEISRTAETVVYSDAYREYRLKNTNELLKEFPGILGGKTGFTDEAKGTLIILYPFKPSKIAVIVLLESEDRFGDGRKIIQWIEEVTK